MNTTRPLRDYQEEATNGARSEFSKGFHSVLIQSVTGTGKTRMVVSMINRAISKNIPGTNIPQSVWFVVPRNTILWQASEELTAWGIKHGMISAKSKESQAFRVHLCSRETLLRRIKENRIKKWPNVIFIDEAHLALDQQLKIKESARPYYNSETEKETKTIFIGVTATPERLDGRGLDEMWDTAVFGHQLAWFVEHEYLKHPKCFRFEPVDGLNKLKISKDGEVSAKKFTSLYESRADIQGGLIYGKEIDNYKENGQNRPFLVFCRSIIDAERIAEEFRESGINCENIDGTMSDKERKRKINGVKNGQIQGLTTVDLLTYGLDVPNISCIILMRFTDSVALLFQMIGRGLRWCGFFKDCLIFDHVGVLHPKKHGHPLELREWNFTGKIKRKKIPEGAIVKISEIPRCDICWDQIIDGICRGCGAEKEKKSRKPMKQVDGYLVEITGPTIMKERDPENQRHYQDMIKNNIAEFREAWEAKGEIRSKNVKNLLEVGKDLKWFKYPEEVYRRLAKGGLTVNVSLLAEIEKLMGYKSGWAWNRRRFLEEYKNK